MRHSKRVELSTVAIAVLAIFGHAACTEDKDDPGKVQSSTVEYTADVDAAGLVLVAIDNVNGTISVQADPGNDHIRMVASACVRASTFAEAESALDNLSVQVEEIDGTLEIETVHPEIYDGRDYWVDYEIRMPANLMLDAVGINGQIDADGLEGFATLSLTNGSITAEASLPPHALVELSVVNGEVWLGVPATTSAKVSACVVNGSVGLQGFDPRGLASSATAISGVLGGGDAEIRLQAVNGEVALAALP